MPEAKPAIQIPLSALRELLGKTSDDPAVQAIVAQLDQPKVSKTAVVAKAEAFELAFEVPEGAKPAKGKKPKPVVTRVFLKRGFHELPPGFDQPTRADLLAQHPAPKQSWTIEHGSVPVDTAGVVHDTWDLDGVEAMATYDAEGRVRSVILSLPDDATGGGSLSTFPLHFATRPADAVPDAELTGMALLIAWAIEKHGLPPRHANASGERLAQRAITPRRFLIDACDKHPTTLDVPPKLATFLSTYTNNTHHDDQGARSATDARIKELLKLEREDTCSYGDDFRGTFKDVLESPFHVPDSWDAVDRISPILDARLVDFEATRFLTSPDVELYERAAALRDARAVTPERADLAPSNIDDGLAEELVGLVEKSLKDKYVKTVLTRAGLPVGKRIDEQANPALGIVYMGTTFEVDSTKILGIESMTFYGAKHSKYVRGLGAQVELSPYTGALPRGLRMGCERDAVRAAYGIPAQTDTNWDVWETDRRRIAATFDADKLVRLHFGKR